MSDFWRHTPRTVRPRSARRTPVLLCLVVFGLTAAAVYGWGQATWAPSGQDSTYGATAHVVERAALPSVADVRIPIAYTADDSQRAATVANTLAERYAQDRRKEWKQRTERPYQEAHKAVERTYGKLAEEETRLSTFRQQMVDEAARRRAAATQKESLPPTMVSNPRWVELDRQRATLERRRDSLLVERTPLHPAVREITDQIDELKQQMAAVPRRIADVHAATQEAAEGPRLSIEAERPHDTQSQEKLSQLTAAVETARQACRQAEAAEKRALEKQQAIPQYTVVYAQAVEIPPTPDYGWLRLMGITMAAGALMAVGVGSVSTGASVEPVVANADQVAMGANATVVGRIPAEDPMPEAESLSRHQSRVRRALIAVGLILMVACPAAALWGIAGL